MYGLLTKTQLDDTIISVCKTLGNGSNNNAHLLLMETAFAETKYGDTPDLNFFSGYGIFQFDEVGFRDTVTRTPAARKDLIRKVYGIDLDQLTLTALQWSPLASAIMCRCFYLLRSGIIPSTLEGRAEYWKKYYNTIAGKGSIEHYISANKYNRSRVIHAFS